MSVQGTIEEQLASALKKLEDAEARCQATTREIWQIDMALGREEDRANAAEQRARELEERVAELERATPVAEPTPVGSVRTQELEGQVRAATTELEAARTRLSELEAAQTEAQAQLAHAREEAERAHAAHRQVEERLQEAQGRAAAAAELEQRLQETESAGLLRTQVLDRAEARLAELERENERRLDPAQVESTLQEVREQAAARLEQVKAELEAQVLEARELATRTQERAEEAERRAQEAESRPVAADPALQGQLDSARLRAYEAEDRARQAEDQSRRAREEFDERVRSLEEQLRAAGEELRAVQARLQDTTPSEEVQVRLRELEARALRAEARALELENGPAPAGGHAELEARLAKAEEMAELHAEKADLLQARSQQAVDRAALAEEKLKEAEERAQTAELRVREAENRLRQAEFSAHNVEDRLKRAEDRARDADSIYAAAEEKAREAEQVSKESWGRVREAELKANQASVELKKLNEKLSEYEKRTQESDRETQRLAFQDALTGLPNYNLINQYLDFTVKQCIRYKRVSALLVIDIDRFKVFNEAMGFKAGDDLLIKIAERLKTAVRDTDSLGRRGEDEFLILLSELNPGEDSNNPEARRQALQNHVELVAKRVMHSLATPFIVQNQKYYIQASIGISLCPDDGDSPQLMFENADTAMYHVKETGRNRYQFYTADLRKRQEKRLTLDTQLRHALERGEFAVYYHPVINLAAGKGKGTLVGVEALLRWNHRIDGLVGPDYFLPAAEESGTIVPIGHWVLAQTCAQMREWLGAGLRIFASVNLSKRQLLQADLVDSMLAIVAEHRIPPEVLYMEIAEGVNTLNPDLMDRVITDLGQAGIRIAIDDFGIGYSSLARINPTYTKILKIDQSIIRGVPNDKQSTTVCIAAINLARSLGLLSLAEGVENANQVKFLTKYECALAQGFFFSEPLMPAEVGALHRNKKVWKF